MEPDPVAAATDDADIHRQLAGHVIGAVDTHALAVQMHADEGGKAVEGVIGPVLGGQDPGQIIVEQGRRVAAALRAAAVAGDTRGMHHGQAVLVMQVDIGARG